MSTIKGALEAVFQYLNDEANTGNVEAVDARRVFLALYHEIEDHGLWRRCAYCGVDRHGVFKRGALWDGAVEILRRHGVVTDGICAPCYRNELEENGLS